MAWPKGRPSPRKGTKQPHFADKDRLTLPSASGKQWPIVFGHGTTKLLMFVALNPGCKWRDAADALELDDVGLFSANMLRLRRKGLVAMLRHRYQINPAIRFHLRAELVAFLRELGLAHGLSPGEKTWANTGPETPRREGIELPINLLMTRHRTVVLAGSCPRAWCTSKG